MSANHHHATLPPSPWVTRWSEQIVRSGTVLDLACGAGRHARWLSSRGFRLVALDRDLSAFVDPPSGTEFVQADIENGPWPLAGRRFDGIVVTNYLHRPLFPVLVESLAPGGILIYETFAVGNEKFGKPSNPDFLLMPGELLDVAAGRLRVLGYEDVQVETPAPAMIQRLCGRRP
jgi:SAM-dependent methyltransferase